MCLGAAEGRAARLNVIKRWRCEVKNGKFYTVKPFFTDTIGLNRLMAFSDGVFSIAITLLVFQLQLPSPLTASVGDTLIQLWPKILCYAVTFQLVGIYWVGHVSISRHLRRYDRNFLLLNTLFLMLIALMPFPTGVLGSFPDERASIFIYAICWGLTGVALAFLWRYATKDGYLVDSEVTAKVVRIAFQRILLGPLVALISIVIAFWSPRAAIGLYVIVGLGYLMPSRIDKIAGDHEKL